MKASSEFSTSENKMTLLYYLAVYSRNFYNDYQASFQYCMDGLKIEDINFTIENPLKNIRSNIAFSLLLCPR